MKKRILLSVFALIDFCSVRAYSEQLNLSAGCYQGTFASNVSALPTATITVRVGKRLEGKYAIRDLDSDLAFLDNITNVKSVRYSIKQSKYNPILVGYPPDTHIGFSLTGVPRVSMKQNSAKKISYARTLREYDSEDMLTETTRIKGDLLKMNSSVCDFAFTNG